MAQTTITATISAEDTFSDPIYLAKGERAEVSISGISGDTVSLQRRLDGTNWRTMVTYTAAAERTVEADCDVEIRLGVETGNYSAGTVVCLLKGADLVRM